MTTQDSDRKRDDYLTALEAFQDAAFALLDAWMAYNGGEANGYPPYLPSFDELAHDIDNWRMEETANT